MDRSCPLAFLLQTSLALIGSLWGAGTEYFTGGTIIPPLALAWPEPGNKQLENSGQFEVVGLGRSQVMQIVEPSLPQLEADPASPQLPPLTLSAQERTRGRGGHLGPPSPP